MTGRTAGGRVVTSNLIIFTVGAAIAVAAITAWIVLRVRPAKGTKGTKGRRW
ncbi:MAG: hypothetical protein H0W90_12590 [Actinobacteria bacterium]|nr:hypothetical protein [Actinomycetota bacterium]